MDNGLKLSDQPRLSAPSVDAPPITMTDNAIAIATTAVAADFGSGFFMAYLQHIFAPK